MVSGNEGFTDQISILVVEDDIAQSELIGYLLSDKKYKLTKIFDGKEALGYLMINDDVDIVIMDNNLPSMNGVDIIKELRLKNRQHSIIFSSADSDINIVIGAMREGALDFLLKTSPNFRLEVVKVVEKIYNLQLKHKHQIELERRIRVSEENYRNLLNEIEDYLFVLDENGLILQVNNLVLSKLGYSFDELLGIHVTKVHPPENKDEVESIITHMFAGNIRTSFVPLYSRDNQKIYVESRINRTIWNGKNVLFALSKDITNLRNSEEKFAKAFGSNPSAMSISSFVDGRIIDVNDSFCRILGYSNQEVVGKSSTELNIYKNFEDWSNINSQVHTNLNIRNLEVDLINKSGNIVHGIISTDLINIGNERCMLTVVTDITDRKIAQTKLQQTFDSLMKSKSSIRSLLDNLPFMAWMKDVDGKYEAVNEPFIKLSGLTVEQIIGKTYNDLDPQRSVVQFNEDDKLVIESKLRINREEELVVDGANIVVESFITPVFDSNGEICGTTGISRDITEKKRLENEILIHHAHDVLLKDISSNFLNQSFDKTDNGINDALEMVGKNIKADLAFILLIDYQKQTVSKVYDWFSDQLINYQTHNYIEKPLKELSWWFEQLKRNEYIHINHLSQLPDSVRETSFFIDFRNIKSLIIAPMLIGENNIIGLTGFSSISSVVNWKKDTRKLIVRVTEIISRAFEHKTWKHTIEVSEKRYRQIVENASEIIFKTDENGNFLYVNPIAVKFLEYSEQELLTMNYFDLVLPEYKDSVSKYFSDQVENEVSSSYLEFPILTKSGKLKWIGQNIQIVDNEGGINEITAVSREITDRYIAQKELEFTSLRLSTIISSLQAGLMVEDDAGKVIIINQQFCMLFSISSPPEQMIGSQSVDIIRQTHLLFKNPDQYIARFNKVLSDKFIEINEEIELQDGRFFERDYVPLFLHDRYIGHFWLFRDITSRKLAEEIITKSEERLQIALKGGNNGLWDWNYQTGELFLTASTFDMLGYPAKSDRIHINKWRKLYFADDVETADNNLQRHLNGETEFYETEQRLLTAKGKYKWVLVRGKIMEWDEAGKPIRITGVNTDIDHIKKMASELILAKAESERANVAKSRFLANMSHEIRTPMNGIIGLSKLLRKTKMEETQTNYLDAIISSADNLLVIINDILDFSKITEGKLQLEKIDIRIDKLVSSLIKSLEFTAKDKEVDLRYSIDPKLNMSLLGDPVRINQILVNLLGNALKFTSDGYVELGVVLDKRELNINFVNFYVKDTGIGIDIEKQQSIFDIFSQEDESVSRKYGGTGLGLAISKQLVEMMNGEINIESKKGKGSKFYFTIPLPDGNVDVLKDEIQDHSEPIDLSNLRVLVAEDHKVNQFLIKAIFRNWKVEPDIAENGLIAIEMLEKKEYDIVFMDKQMPEMGGVEATVIIREQLKLDLPIIALTAAALKGSKEQALESGMNDYITKPFEADDLLNIIRKYVKKTSPKSNTLDELIDGNMKQANASGKLYGLKTLLNMFSNNKDSIREMIQLFIDTTQPILDEILVEYERNNYSKVGDLAHKLKPSIDFMEIESLKQVIRDMESAGKATFDDGKLKEVIPIFAKTIPIILLQLKDELATMEG